MPLRRKLLFAMMIPAILLITVGAIGVYSLRHLEQAAGRILADNYRSIQETRRMEEALRGVLIAGPEWIGGAAQPIPGFHPHRCCAFNSGIKLVR